MAESNAPVTGNAPQQGVPVQPMGTPVAATRKAIQPAARPNPDSVPVVVCLKDVLPEQVDWLWQDRIPKGNLTMLEGDPGKGKSWCSLAIAAAVTLGRPLPGDEELEGQIAPAKVLLLSAEDGPADTIHTRLQRMGADLSRVHVLTAVKNRRGEERHLSLVQDLGAVDTALSEGEYGLVIIDPLNAYLGLELDTYKDSALRSVLTPLKQLAAKYKIAIVCIRHLTKSSRAQPIYRGQGSIAYTAAARVAHIVGVNPHNDRERIIACIKNNLAEFPLPYIFEIRNGCFYWKGASDVDIDLLLKTATSQEGQSSAMNKAMEFLQTALLDGQRPAAGLEREAFLVGISKTTLKRARQKLNVRVHREGFGADGGWIWTLPEAPKETDADTMDF